MVQREARLCLENSSRRRAFSALFELLYAEGDGQRAGSSYEEFSAKVKASLVLDPYQAASDAQAGNSIYLHRLVQEPGGTLLLTERRIVFASRSPDRPLEAVFDAQLKLGRHGYREANREGVRLIDRSLPGGGLIGFNGPAVAAEFEHNATRAFVPEVLNSFGTSMAGADAFCQRYTAQIVATGKIDGTWVKRELEAGYLSPSDASIIQRVMEIFYHSAVPNNCGMGLIASHSDTASVLRRLRLEMGAEPSIGMRVQAPGASSADPFSRMIKHPLVGWFVANLASFDITTIVEATAVSECDAYLAARQEFAGDASPTNWQSASEALERYLLSAATVARRLWERADRIAAGTADPRDTDLRLDGSQGLHLRAQATDDGMDWVPADPTKLGSTVQVVVHRDTFLLGHPSGGRGSNSGSPELSHDPILPSSSGTSTQGRGAKLCFIRRPNPPFIPLPHAA